MDICTKFHCNPSNTCRNMSLKKQKCLPAGGARRKVMQSPKSSGQNFIDNPSNSYNKIYSSGPKWWTDQPTDRMALPSLEPWLKTEAAICNLELKLHIRFFLEPWWSLQLSGKAMRKVTWNMQWHAALNPANDRHDISFRARMNKVCTCQMNTVYTESGCSLLTLTLQTVSTIREQSIKARTLSSH